MALLPCCSPRSPDVTPQIETVAETASTNSDLSARLTSNERVAESAWLVADRQTAGRGRQGRAWIDGHGNFMGSTTVHCQPQDPPAPSLALLAGLALYETVAAITPVPAGLKLKWPNDLLLNGRKLAGILLEGVQNAVVIGIGVNLAQASALPEREAASLAEYGPAPNRDMFAVALARQWAVELDRWRQFGLEPILSRWIARAHDLGTTLRVHEPDGAIATGIFAGLAADGALQLKRTDGTVRVIHAGDVTWER